MSVLEACSDKLFCLELVDGKPCLKKNTYIITKHKVSWLYANKQLLDEVFVICRIINVEVRVISRAEGEADNSYRDIDNFAYHKNRIQ